MHDRTRTASATLTLLNVCAWAYAVTHTLLALA